MSFFFFFFFEGKNFKFIMAIVYLERTCIGSNNKLMVKFLLKTYHL